MPELTTGAELTFEQLVARLGGTPLRGEGTPALAVRSPKTFFVEPKFTVTQSSADSPVVLVSARGAAGKSATADALSERLEAPVWRLQDDAAVSRASVHSTLVQHLSVTDPLTQLPAGAPLVMIDSLDEARSRVSTTSWSEFVQALVEAVHAGLRVVFFGRTRTLEDLWVNLEDADIRPDWYEVSHLDEQGRARYVDERVLLRQPTAPIGNAAYQQARDAVMDALRAPLPEDDVERFLGYPPVLDAVAALLVENHNYIALRNEFASTNVQSQSEVLRRILDQIMKREQAKVGPLAQDLGVDSAVTYRPEEQARWLLHDLEQDAPPSPDAIADLTTRLEYVNRLAEFRRDHPFRSESKWASPVFQADVIAMLFDTASPQSILRAGQASGLLFELVSGAVPDELVIDEAQFAALHASLLAGQWRDADASVTLGSLDGLFQGEFFMDYSEPPLEFLLDPADPGEVRLHGPLTGLTVDVDCRVRIPADVRDAVLGPDLHLSGRSVRIEGERVAFGLRDDEQGLADVRIQADELALPASITPPIPRQGVVEIVAGTPLPFPWNAYMAEPEDLPDAFDDRAVRLLNKLMALVRVHGHDGERAVYVNKLRGRQGLHGEQFQQALDVLQRHGVIRLKGEMVFYSANWEPHRYHGKSAEGMRQLSDCLDAWRPVLQDLSAAIQRNTWSA